MTTTVDKKTVMLRSKSSNLKNYFILISFFIAAFKKYNKNNLFNILIFFFNKISKITLSVWTKIHN